MTNPELSVSMGVAAELILQAGERVVLANPGVHPVILKAILEVHQRLPGRVLVVLDTNEEVFRLGYGVVETLQSLQESRVPLLRREGLRLGLLLVDDKAWCFAPTALLVEADMPEGSLRLNACPLPETSAIHHLRALAESSELERALKDHMALEPAESNAEPVTKGEVEAAQKQLEVAPPKNFDLHRQVLVYQSYVQYVEFKFRGGDPSAVKARIPKELLPVGTDPELERHLQTTVDLFQSQIEGATKDLQVKVEEMRAKYIRSLGEPYGNVVLTRDVPTLRAEANSFIRGIGHQQLTLAKLMADERSKTIEKLTEVCLQNLQRAPNDWMKARSRHGPPNIETLRFEVNALLDSKLPKAFHLAGRMELVCFFKDFTFDSLTDEAIFDKLQKAFPDEEWDKPYEKAQAALESKKLKTE